VLKRYFVCQLTAVKMEDSDSDIEDEQEGSNLNDEGRAKPADAAAEDGNDSGQCTACRLQH
jgi:hypothetical protein